MTATQTDDDLLIVRNFDAPAALIFRLWTDPAHFRRWIGPKEFECIETAIDLRVGGAYHAVIRSSGTGDSRFSGVYREIEPNRRLVFTFAWHEGPAAGVETLVTILLEERDGRTTQTFHQAPFLKAEHRDSHRGGWNSTFDRLADYAITQRRQDQR